jgi:DNA invertase Pin-like site-specific DNA recombinase
MKRAYGYLRVSTTTQVDEGFSLDHQRQAIKDYCKTRSLHLVQIYMDEGKSGRTTNRPEFQQMLKAIKEKGIDSVVIYKIDRFARNVTDFSRICNEFKENNINLISVLEGDLSSGSSLVPNIFASVAQWESEVNSQRTKDALLEKFNFGWQPTPPPIGYVSMGGDGERKYCEIDPNVGPIIKKIFELYSTGQYSMITLQEWLKDKNIISRNGTIISFSRINNILNNPFYYGLIRWHGVEKMGKQTPLISKQLFDTCKYILEKHRHFLVRERKYDFLLRGFTNCTCGMRLVGDYSLIRSTNTKLGYYHCQKRYSPDCKQKYIQAKVLEQYVEDYIKKVEFTDQFIAQVQQQAKDFLNTGKKETNGMKQAFINQKTGLENKRNKLEDLLIDESIDKDTYKRKHLEITEQLNNLQIQTEEVEEESNLDMSLIEETLALTKDIYKTYKNAPDALKRHYLRFFYEGFVVDNKEIVEANPTPIFNALKNANMARLRTTELPREDSNLEPTAYK